MIDVTAFRAFEQAGWNARADSYERFFTAASEHNVKRTVCSGGDGLQVPVSFLVASGRKR